MFILILQQIEGNLIYPKVVGTSIGLPGLWVLAAVTIGGGISGVLGMLLGVPIAAALYRILREDLHRFEAVQAPAPAEEKTEAVPATRYFYDCVDECKYCGYQRDVRRSTTERN